ncbi:MAG: A/G-specific adenine glycosylase [Burkholderiales bacterium PBB1]|nr:MAG: A/G-specific adenine glycosylase [Burkholderiales bacterium PBB1]
MSERRAASPAQPPAFSTRIVEWQQRHGRHGLPWQHTRDPYRVWLSEIMLQQTQVTTVLGYYERFLQRFPDVAALAAASQDEVLALWSGLGYYSRARNLHRCAQAVVSQHGGRFPSSSEQLQGLPGIGRSTAAAVAAFCFGERVAILDGNVKRVLTRVLGFAGDLAQAAHERELWARATALLPEQGIEPYTQGLMDLGATLCSVRAPQCLLCPVRELCVAATTQTQASFPVKTRKLKRGKREHVWLWLCWRNRMWLVQRPELGVWAGLWSLPEFDNATDFERHRAGWPGHAETLAAFKHVLTHLDWTLHPVRWTLPADLDEAQAAAIVAAWPTGRWFTHDEALAAGLPAPLRKLLLS